MGKIFASTYANLAIGCHALVSKYFENSWSRFLDDCQVLLKVSWIKPYYLLSIINQINNNTQFTMEKKQTRLPFLDIMIKKIVQKSEWIFTTN